MDLIAANSSGLCTVHEDSGQSSTARTQRLRYLRITSTEAATRQAVLFTGGLHAREWAPPDALLQFAEYLIDAYKNNNALDLRAIVGSVYLTGTGGTPGPAATFDLPAARISSNEVQRAMEKLEIYIAPLVNPDGRDYTMAPYAGPGPLRPQIWRKNHPPPDGTNPNPAPALGANLNGNFPVPKPVGSPTLPTHWENLQRYYGPTGLSTAATSNDPTEWQDYGGPTDASENETRFVQWLVEQKHVRFSMDVHSAAHLISYPWAMEKNGSDATQRFTETAWDSTPGVGPAHVPPAAHPPGRDGVAGTVYNEYVPDDPPYRLRQTHRTVSRSMRDAILNAAGADPIARQRSLYNDFVRFGAPDFGHPGPGPVEGSIAELIYAAPASGMDWIFSRQFTDATLAPIYSFVLECGDVEEGQYWPDYLTQFPKIEREIVLGAMEFLKFASQWRPASASRCYVATAVYGSSLHPEIQFAVQYRERELRRTPAGKKFLDLIERGYGRAGPPVARWLARHETARGIVKRAAVEPLFRAIRSSEGLVRRIRSRERRVAAFIALISAFLLLGAAAAVGFLVLVLYWAAHA